MINVLPVRIFPTDRHQLATARLPSLAELRECSRFRENPRKDPRVKPEVRGTQQSYTSFRFSSNAL